MPTIPDLDNTSGGNKMNKTIKDIAEIGIFIGLALILNLPVFKIHITNNAGSISFVMIPLFIIAIRKVWWKSFIAGGIIYGLFACLISGHNFITYPFDYLLGFGSIALISLFQKLILKDNRLSYLFLIVASVLATILRIIFSTISGVIIYEYNFISSFIYNAPYISITGAIGIIVMIFLLKPLKIINSKEKEIY